jgi:hypothetical protein
MADTEEAKPDQPVVNEAARELSKLGASKGGQARANKLTPEERSAIARNAVVVRWERSGKTKIVKAIYGSPDRPLHIANMDIPCYVLEDGRRVLVQGGMLTALNISSGGATKTTTGDRLTKFIETSAIKPYVEPDLEDRIKNPIRFRTSTGQEAYGYEATMLPDICNAVLKSREEKAIHKQQLHIATACEILVRAFAKVGIIALVDEATGYQYDRARDALAKILEAFIAKELCEWVKTFSDDYYRELFRLRGWNYQSFSTKRPVLAGKLTNDIVYERLAPAVLDELKRLNPMDEKGRRPHKFFQWLTPNLGHPRLREHLAAVTALMKAAGTWEEFKKSLDRALPRQIAMPLFEQQYKATSSPAIAQ